MQNTAEKLNTYRKSNGNPPMAFWIIVFVIVFVVVYRVTKDFCNYPGTVAIMTVNVVVIALIWIGKLSVNDLGSSYISIYKNKQLYRTLTAGFTHAAPVHILMNLFSLFNIGSVLEPYLDSQRYLLFYFLVLIIGGFLGAAIHKIYLPEVICIGASGAICGMLGVYIAIIISFYGKQEITSIIPTVGILCLQVFWKRVDSIAHFSGLITGFLLGILYFQYLRF